MVAALSFEGSREEKNAVIHFVRHAIGPKLCVEVFALRGSHLPQILREV